MRFMNNSLQTLMYPRSIALAGATNNPVKMGMLPCLSILRGGYRGKFFPVSRKEETILGVKAWQTVADLPETPDLGIIIVPTEYVIGLVDEFGKKGTKNLVIVTAGFKESGKDGNLLEVSLKETAAKYGIRFVGPNCLGIINTDIKLNISGMSVDESPGSLGFLSHSGTYVAQTAAYLNKRGIRFSKAISLGNEADIDIVDALEYLGEDEQTRAVALYMEGLSNGERFIEVARKVAEKKPVVAHYSGGSDAGARSSSSHTGAMAGPDHLFDGIFKQAGIIRVHSIEDLYAHGWALATQPPLRGKRIGIITNSGGPGTSVANTCSVAGLEVPLFSNELQQDIRYHLFDHAPSKNPVDVTFTFDMEILGRKIPRHILEHDEADGLIIHGTFTSGFVKAIYHNFKGVMDVPLDVILSQFKSDPSKVVSLPFDENVPVLVSSFFDREDNFTEAYQDNNVPVFDSPEKAAHAMHTLWKRNKIVNRKKLSKIRLPEVSEKAAGIIAEAKKKGHGALDEYKAKQLIASYGIPITEEILAANSTEALAAAEQIGYPVVLKACHFSIQHKTGKGLISLNLKNEEEVKEAFEMIVANAGPDTSVLVQEMITGTRECMAGIIRFEGFGPAVMFGFGGIYTEIINDTTLRLAPLAIEDADEMLEELRLSPMLDEFRGMPRVDRNALAAILQTAGFIAMLHPEISEMDLNPIIFAGERPVVADALIVL